MRAPAVFILVLPACTVPPAELLGGLTSLDGGTGSTGSNDGSLGVDASFVGSSLTQEAYCEESYELLIARREECFNLSPSWSEEDLDAHFFLETCRATGRYRFDANAGEACLATRRAQSCHELFVPWHFDQVESCERVFRGTVSEGGECNRLDECLDGLVCDVEPPLGACTRRCVPASGSKRDGQSCSTIHDCLEGLECPEVVVPGRACGSHPSEGEVCAPGPVDACEPNVTCSFVTQRCERVKQEGERCQLNNDCAPGLTCRGLRDQEVCAVAGKVGESCLFGQGGCNDFAYCDEDNRCVALPITGEPCNMTGLPQCRDGWFCAHGSWTCELKRLNESACSDDRECLSGKCIEYACRDRCE